MAEQGEFYKKGSLGEKLKLSRTELEASYLFNYLFEIWNDLADLELELISNRSLENFPKYRELGEVVKGLGRYVNELSKYGKDVKELVLEKKDWLEDTLNFLGYEVYPVALEVDKYRTTEFRKRWKDDITDELEETKDLVEDVKKSEGILRKLYKMHDVEPELVEKSEKMKKIGRPEKALILIALIVGLSFGTLKVLSGAQSGVGTTGFFIAPTAEIAGVNFEMLYVITSSMILGIYILGKLMKKW